MFWYAKLFFFNHFWFLGKSIYGILAQSSWKAICVHGKHVAWVTE